MPVSLLATLVYGLDEDSRIGRIRDGRKASISTCYIAELCDMFESVILGLSGIDGSPNRLGALLTERESGTNKPGLTVDEFTRLRESIMK